MVQYYENHALIRQNKLCPFWLRKTTDIFLSPVCNWHKNIEILFITDGTGMIQYNADLYPISEGDIVVINSGTIHRPYSETGIGFYLLIIDESFCAENGIDITVFDFDRKIRDKETEALFVKIAERTDDGDDRDALSIAAMRSAVLSLLVHLCQHHARQVSPRGEKDATAGQYAKTVIDYINENFSQHIYLESLAELCGITKFHLAREFKKYTGQTVFSYINFLRCKKAEIYMSEGMSVTEAAYESGFESLSYFSRTYKRLMGISPSGMTK